MESAMTYEPLAFPAAVPTAIPEVRKINFADVKQSLAQGFDDFKAKPSHVFFLGIIYPLLGLFLIRLALGYKVLPLLFPMVAGFLLLGPLAAIGFYEISRRREEGLDASWWRAFGLLRSHSIGAILALAGLLILVFVAWLWAAESIYVALFGPQEPVTVTLLLDQVFGTRNGLWLLLIGNFVGFLFALFVFSMSVVSFPLLIDRDVGAPAAMVTSFKAVTANPVVMLQWALLITAAVIIGSLPLLLGLAIVLPILGHASWHLYRKVVAR
jgi:uncharacterized membrane protein